MAEVNKNIENVMKAFSGESSDFYLLILSALDLLECYGQFFYALLDNLIVAASKYRKRFFLRLLVEIDDLKINCGIQIIFTVFVNNSQIFGRVIF